MQPPRPRPYPRSPLGPSLHNTTTGQRVLVAARSVARAGEIATCNACFDLRIPNNVSLPLIGRRQRRKYTRNPNIALSPIMSGSSGTWEREILSSATRQHHSAPCYCSNAYQTCSSYLGVVKNTSSPRRQSIDSSPRT